ncbi:MAG: hypothetical protein KBH08_06435 [Brachymonas sp.]|nr:hypothetical protein [Brachymonas sp.]
MTTPITDAERALSEQIAEQGGQLAACRDKLIAAEARVAVLEAAIQTAYGYLWCVNNEPGTPNQYSPERAAHEARKHLRGMLTTEQRGHGINDVLPIVRARQ